MSAFDTPASDPPRKGVARTVDGREISVQTAIGTRRASRRVVLDTGRERLIFDAEQAAALVFALSVQAYWAREID